MIDEGKRDSTDEPDFEAASGPRAEWMEERRSPDDRGRAEEGSDLADGQRRHPDRRHVRLERWTGQIGNVFFLGFMLIIVLVLLLLSVTGPQIPDSAWRIAAGIWLVLASFLIWMRHFWPAISHRHYTWALDARGLDLRRGVIWREEVHVPSSRIQHTDVTQGPLERRLGLATLVVHTAGTHQASVSVHGLDEGDARAIRDHLARALDLDDAV